MSEESDLIADLRNLNNIAFALNQAADVYGALNDSLAELVQLLKLDSGWIFLRDPAAVDMWYGPGFRLASHYNLPPAMDTANPVAWNSGCDCQGLFTEGQLDKAYNEVRCSRLAELVQGRNKLRVHASAPLRYGDEVLGILNVAAPDWDAFSPRALELISNVGAQMGAALERARLFDLLKEKRYHEQAALLEFSNQLLDRLDLDELVTFIVNEAQRLLQVDACSILLPEDDGQLLTFRASTGWMSDPAAQERTVPADDRSLSGQVMISQKPATLNVRSQGEEISRWTAEWIDEEGFITIAIAPLIVQGRSIGVMVAQRRNDRDYTKDDIRFLQLFANQAAIAIEKTRLQAEEFRRQRLEEELAVGRHIQLSLLPKSSPRIKGWSIADSYEPARQVGGDFYDFFELPDQPGHIGLVIADVSGKGVPAALFMAVSRTYIRSVALGGASPAEALQKANELIVGETAQSGFFLSAFYAILDTKTGKMRYANAGHNPPLWFKAKDKKFKSLVGKGIVLCVLDKVTIEEQYVEISDGDILVFYTDGVTEAVNDNLEEFGEQRLQDVIAAARDGTASMVVDEIIDAVYNFLDNLPQTDDLTLIVVKRIANGEGL